MSLTRSTRSLTTSKVSVKPSSPKVPQKPTLPPQGSFPPSPAGGYLATHRGVFGNTYKYICPKLSTTFYSSCGKHSPYHLKYWILIHRNRWITCVDCGQAGRYLA